MANYRFDNFGTQESSIRSQDEQEIRDLMDTLPPFVRIVGRDKSVGELLQQDLSADRQTRVRVLHAGNSSNFDYAQIDPELTVAKPLGETPVTPPQTRVGYAGLTPEQRYQMLKWCSNPLATAPQVIRQLYLAQLETTLFDSHVKQQQALQQLQHLLASSTWHHHEGASRAVLLGFWLYENPNQFTSWLARGELAPSMMGIALGQLAMMNGQLSPALFAAVANLWHKPSAPGGDTLPLQLPSTALLSLRLSSLTSSLNQEPLAYALDQLSDQALEPQTWRSNHRELRLAVPQPDLKPVLQPLLLEAVGEARRTAPVENGTASGGAQRTSRDPAEEHGANQTSGDRDSWRLVLEFGQSRSEYFDFALFRARQRPDYTQIMDEDRNLIHRVIFTKSEMRHFWALWEYVQSWSTTRVFLNGEELEKTRVYRYSQYLE